MLDLKHKNFKNDICQQCIRRNIKKYGKFNCDCEGITVESDVRFAVKNGYTEEEARWMFDPAYFFEKIYGSPARPYQHRLLYCTSKNMAARQCRQTGKTLLIMYRIFHFISTNAGKTVLVVAPQEVQLKKIWDEYIFRDFVYKDKTIEASIDGKPTMSPNYQIKFDNGSKIILMIAGPGIRGQTADWIYIDEAAIISKDILSDIMMAIASKEDDANIIMTSTPKGRGNPFYEACRDNPEFAEFHVSIYDVEEMKGQIARFKKLLGDTGFVQEAEAEFPDASGGPFNYKGIDLAKSNYEYENTFLEPGFIYLGGVDWNGPNVGTYLTVVGFNPNTYVVKVVDRKVVASANWNSLVAKQTLISLNAKWNPKHWMVDYGYGHGIVEELKLWSIRREETGIPHLHPDCMLKHTIDPIEFGSWIEMEDPFTKEINKKTTKSYIISQVSRLFEPENGMVPISFPESDNDIIKSLENYKLLNITAKGVEQYGFDKKSDIEDHLIDSLFLAIYGIVKNYNELFRRMVALSVSLNAREIMQAPTDNVENNIIDARYGRSIVLLTDNSPEQIYLDENSLKKYEPKEEKNGALITRTFNRSMQQRKNQQMTRKAPMVSRIIPL